MTSIGLVKNVPSPKSGGNSKSPGPGAWNSSPSAAASRPATLTRCKASPFPARCIGITYDVQKVCRTACGSRLTVPEPHEPDSPGRPQHDPDCDEPAGAQPQVDEPPDPAVEDDPGEQVADHRPGVDLLDGRCLGRLLRHGRTTLSQPWCAVGSASSGSAGSTTSGRQRIADHTVPAVQARAHTITV